MGTYTFCSLSMYVWYELVVENGRVSSSYKEEQKLTAIMYIQKYAWFIHIVMNY